jgi:hypothetical protein
MASDGRVSGIDQLTIRSWPKIIFLYPVMLAAFICGTVQSVGGGMEEPFAETIALIFFVVLCLNLMVISFEFSRFRTMATLFFILAVVFFLLYLGTRWEVFAFLRSFVQSFHMKLSSSFYFALGTYLLAMLFAVFITTRFDYWIIRSNEILHKEGFLGDVRRYPSPNLKMTKEIPDVFEFVLLGAGRVVLYPQSEKQAIVLDHVLRANYVERGIQDLLSALSVEITGPSSSLSEEEESPH